MQVQKPDCQEIELTKWQRFSGAQTKSPQANSRTTPFATKIALEVVTRNSVVAATDIGMSSLQKVKNLTIIIF